MTSSTSGDTLPYCVLNSPTRVFSRVSRRVGGEPSLSGVNFTNGPTGDAVSDEIQLGPPGDRDLAKSRDGGFPGRVDAQRTEGALFPRSQFFGRGVAHRRIGGHGVSDARSRQACQPRRGESPMLFPIITGGPAIPPASTTASMLRAPASRLGIVRRPLSPSSDR
jgi:hypothetical protein